MSLPPERGRSVERASGVPVCHCVNYIWCAEPFTIGGTMGGVSKLFLPRLRGRGRYFASALYGGYLGGCTPKGWHRAEEAPLRGRSPFIDPHAGESGNEGSIAADPPTDPLEPSEIIQMHRQAVRITVLAQ